MADLHANVFAGYVSWRDTQAGSWYVENLDRVLEENVATDDLVTMLMMVRLCPVKLLNFFLKTEAATNRYNKYILKSGKNNKPTSIIMLPIRVESSMTLCTISNSKYSVLQLINNIKRDRHYTDQA